jgi:hypothetical protein
MGALVKEERAEAVRARSEVSFPPIPLVDCGGNVRSTRLPAPSYRATGIPAAPTELTNGCWVNNVSIMEQESS